MKEIVIRRGKDPERKVIVQNLIITYQRGRIRTEFCFSLPLLLKDLKTVQMYGMKFQYTHTLPGE